MRNVKRNSYIFIRENAFQKVVRKLAAILSQLQYDNPLGCINAYLCLRYGSFIGLFIFSPNHHISRYWLIFNGTLRDYDNPLLCIDMISDVTRTLAIRLSVQQVTCPLRENPPLQWAAIAKAFRYHGVVMYYFTSHRLRFHPHLDMSRVRSKW